MKNKGLFCNCSQKQGLKHLEIKSWKTPFSSVSL